MINVTRPLISKQLFADQIGVSTGTIDGWMKREWTNGCEYVVKGHTTLVCIERADKWLNGLLELDREEMASKSKSGDTESEFIPKRSRATRIGKLISPAQLSAATTS